jgi:hypothetical protein
MAFSFFRPRVMGPLRGELLNDLIAKRGYRRYLEIGVRDPRQNFDTILAEEKHGVDPDPLAPISHRMTSDAFFAQRNPESAPYDLAFIDGLHLAEQVERDVLNCLDSLSENGAVVLHDCNPPTRDAQSDDYDGKKHWNGTVWKAWAKLRATRSDLSMWVVNIDEGCGVIRRGEQALLSLQTLDYRAMDYALLKRNRDTILNLVSLEDFWRVF